MTTLFASYVLMNKLSVVFSVAENLFIQIIFLDCAYNFHHFLNHVILLFQFLEINCCAIWPILCPCTFNPNLLTYLLTWNKLTGNNSAMSIISAPCCRKYGCYNTVGSVNSARSQLGLHDDVIKWKHFPPYWPFVCGIHRSPVNSQHKGRWRTALMFSLICAWINGWVNNGETGDLRRHRSQYDLTVMLDPNLQPI